MILYHQSHLVLLAMSTSYLTPSVTSPNKFHYPAPIATTSVISVTLEIPLFQLPPLMMMMLMRITYIAPYFENYTARALYKDCTKDMSNKSCHTTVMSLYRYTRLEWCKLMSGWTSALCHCTAMSLHRYTLLEWLKVNTVTAIKTKYKTLSNIH